MLSPTNLVIPTQGYYLFNMIGYFSTSSATPAVYFSLLLTAGGFDNGQFPLYGPGTGLGAPAAQLIGTGPVEVYGFYAMHVTTFTNVYIVATNATSSPVALTSGLDVAYATLQLIQFG